MQQTDNMTTNAAGISAGVQLAAAYDQAVAADPNGDPTAFFATDANQAVLTASDGSGREFVVTLGPDGSANQDTQAGSASGMITNRGQLSQLLAVYGAIVGTADNPPQTSVGYANLQSGDGQYVLELAVQPN